MLTEFTGNWVDFWILNSKILEVTLWITRNILNFEKKRRHNWEKLSNEPSKKEESIVIVLYCKVHIILLLLLLLFWRWIRLLSLGLRSPSLDLSPLSLSLSTKMAFASFSAANPTLSRCLIELKAGSSASLASASPPRPSLLGFQRWRRASGIVRAEEKAKNAAFPSSPVPGKDRGDYEVAKFYLFCFMLCYSPFSFTLSWLN